MREEKQRNIDCLGKKAGKLSLKKGILQQADCLTPKFFYIVPKQNICQVLYKEKEKENIILTF